MGKLGLDCISGIELFWSCYHPLYQRRTSSKCSFKHVISHFICLCYLYVAFFLFFLLLFGEKCIIYTRRLVLVLVRILTTPSPGREMYVRGGS